MSGPGAKDIEAGPQNPETGDEEPKEGEDGEPEIKGEPRTFQQKAAAHNISVTQYQVEEVIGIMRENVDKVLERDAKLGEMEERAETLYEGASAFQKSAGSLKNKMWLANLKQTIIMVIIGVILLALGSKYFGMW
ncbi:unnamed protein product [Allacma fusca]|uniref:V-SNARE coiled-coil homology domain-containing protein n=1 Tax=Allacma fusca TaxID=39272 RepID=A0A8J2PIB0_9HEXA|nr:unnamed protein product [Allacma fusca]